jgi:hypothetical protein
MANQERIDQWCEVAEMLNGIILSTGKKIQKDNPQIWSGILHTWNNEDWLAMIELLLTVEQEQPNTLTYSHKTTIAEARSTLLRATHPRQLDLPGEKKKAWKLLMALRETWNKINDIDCENKDLARPKTDIEHTKDYTRITIWHNLFEAE